MSENEFVAEMHKAMRRELSKLADEEIERLTQLFCDELEKRKSEIIGGIINQIQILINRNTANMETVFQINIRS